MTRSISLVWSALLGATCVEEEGIPMGTYRGVVMESSDAEHPATAAVIEGAVVIEYERSDDETLWTVTLSREGIVERRSEGDEWLNGGGTADDGTR